MSELTRYISESTDLYPLDWDVSIDRRTGSPAFINQQASLTILVLSPGTHGGREAHKDNGWIAHLINENPLSTLEPTIIASANNELELIIKIEAVLEQYAQENQHFLEALALLQKTGLIIETPIEVVAGFVGSSMSLAQRIQTYLNLGSPLVNPCVFNTAIFQAALEEIGLNVSEANVEAARLGRITQTLDAIKQQMQ
jgi:histidinol-phosphate/aromatic aminotransferase/cobyric acid decarboxylase-like protein